MFAAFSLVILLLTGDVLVDCKRTFLDHGPGALLFISILLCEYTDAFCECGLSFQGFFVIFDCFQVMIVRVLACISSNNLNHIGFDLLLIFLLPEELLKRLLLLHVIFFDLADPFLARVDVLAE